MGNEALKGLSLAERMGLGAKVAKLADSNPVIAEIIDAGLNVVRTGTASGIQSGLHDPSASSVETGAAFGAGGQLVGEAAGAGAARLFPRTTAAAEKASTEQVAQAASQRQSAAKYVTNLAGQTVDDATGTLYRLCKFRSCVDFSCKRYC